MFGNTALWLAARSGAVVIIKILLDAGANINKAKGIADYWSVPARDTGGVDAALRARPWRGAWRRSGTS